MRVLLVDNDPDFLKFVRDALTEFKANIQVAGTVLSPTEALERLEDIAPDVALVDLAMPGMDGIACAKEILQRRPGTAVVIMTGSPQNLHCENALSVRGLVQPLTRAGGVTW